MLMMFKFKCYKGMIAMQTWKLSINVGKVKDGAFVPLILVRQIHWLVLGGAMLKWVANQFMMRMQKT